MIKTHNRNEKKTDIWCQLPGSCVYKSQTPEGSKGWQETTEPSTVYTDITTMNITTAKNSKISVFLY